MDNNEKYMLLNQYKKEEKELADKLAKLRAKIRRLEGKRLKKYWAKKCKSLIATTAVVMLLAGCGSTPNFYIYDKDKDGLMHVGQVQQDTAGSAHIETKGTKMGVDTREPNWWERNVMPIFSGVAGKASDSVEYPVK